MEFKTDYASLCTSIDDEQLLCKDAKYSLYLFHQSTDPEGVNRLRLDYGSISLELLPSKGLSPIALKVKGRDIFWEPPAP